MTDDDRDDARREQESAAKDAMHAAEVGGAHANPDDRRGGTRGGDDDGDEDEAEDRTSQFEDTGSQPTGS